MAKQDENRGYVLMGEDPSGNAIPLKISADGELVVQYVTPTTSSGSSNPTNLDENRAYTELAQNPSDVADPMVCDSRGYIKFDTTHLIIS